MGKTLTNYLTERGKFSPKKKRQPIHPHVKGTMRCPLHDGDQNRACIRKGCATWERKQLKSGSLLSRPPPSRPPL